MSASLSAFLLTWKLHCNCHGNGSLKVLTDWREKVNMFRIHPSQVTPSLAAAPSFVYQHMDASNHVSFARSWQKPKQPEHPASVVIDFATYLLTISSPDIDNVAMNLMSVMAFTQIGYGSSCTGWGWEDAVLGVALPSNHARREGCVHSLVTCHVCSVTWHVSFLHAFTLLNSALVCVRAVARRTILVYFLLSYTRSVCVDDLWLLVCAVMLWACEKLHCFRVFVRVFAMHICLVYFRSCMKGVHNCLPSPCPLKDIG